MPSRAGFEYLSVKSRHLTMIGSRKTAGSLALHDSNLKSEVGKQKKHILVAGGSRGVLNEWSQLLFVCKEGV